MAIFPYKLLKTNPADSLKVPKFDNVTTNKNIIITLDDYNKILERFPLGNSFIFRYKLLLILECVQVKYAD